MPATPPPESAAPAAGPSPAAQQPPATPPPAARRRNWALRTLAALSLVGSHWLGGALLVLVLALLAPALEGSLALVLHLAPMPAALGEWHWQGVSGSIWRGGHIDQLDWRGPRGQTLHVRNLRLRWSPWALWQGRLQIDLLRAQTLRLSPATAAAPAWTPLPDVHLPLRVQAQLEIDQLETTALPNLRLSGVQASYIFDSYFHKLDVHKSTFSSGKYTAQAQLTAGQPLALAVQIQGEAAGQPIDLGGGTALQGPALRIAAQLSGDLAGDNPSLRLNAQVRGLGQSATQADLQAQLQPAQPQPLTQLQAHWQGLDLHALHAQAPHTALSGQAHLHPLAAPASASMGGSTGASTGADWQAQFELRNARPGAWNAGELPVQSLSAALQTRAGQWQLKHLQASLGRAQVQAQGRWSAAGWALQGQLSELDLQALNSRFPMSSLRGELQILQHTQALDWRLALNEARLDWRAAGQGQWVRAQQQFSAAIEAQAPGLQAQLAGLISPLAGQVQLSAQSQAGVDSAAARAGWALIGLRPDGPAQLQAQWRGGWRDAWNSAQLQLKAQVQSLALTPKASGQAASLHEVQLSADGPLNALAFNATGRWQGAASAPSAADAPSAPFVPSAPIAPSAAAPSAWAISARGQGVLGVSPQGLNLSWHDLQLSAPLPTGSRSLVAQLQAPWNLAIARVPVHATSGTAPGPAARSAAPNPPSAEAAPAWSLQLGAALWQLSGPGAQPAQLRWDAAQALWQAGAVQLAPAWHGRLDGLSARWLEAVLQRPLADLGLQTDLVLGGQWQLRTAPTLQAAVLLERRSGDWRLQASEGAAWLALGVQEARVQMQIDARSVSALALWDSARAGRGVLAFGTELGAPGQPLWPDTAPVGARLQFQLPPVQAWSALLPPGWRMHGTADVDLALAGTRHDPQWSGHLHANDVALSARVQGLDLSGGALSARLEGTRLIIERLQVRGAGTGRPQRTTPGAATGDLPSASASTAAGGAASTPPGGTLSLSGSLQWNPDSRLRSLWAHLSADLQVQAEHLRLTHRPDRRASLSGQARVRLQDAELLLRGAARIDSALITLPETSAPSLGSDVRIRSRQAAAPASGPRPDPWARIGLRPDLLLTLDAGDDFNLRGRGLSSRLSGLVVLQVQEHSTPAVYGTVATQAGQYRAWGQALKLSRGELRFTGAADNPDLDILALRTSPNSSQQVGVEVLGTARSPIVRLFADPDLPEAEKLVWLLTGRSSAGGAQAALLQQAALALLTRPDANDPSLTQRLGLDEFSLGQAQRTNADGQTLSSTTLTLGKRLSDDFYVTFETGVGGALGVFSVFYDLTRRLTLRAQTGSTNAIDLISAWRYD